MVDRNVLLPSTFASSACVMAFRSGQELRDEAVEVVRTLDWHDVGRAVALDHFELGAENILGDLAALVHWREQISLADDAEGGCLHACQAVQYIEPQERLGLSIIACGPTGLGLLDSIATVC